MCGRASSVDFPAQGSWTLATGDMDTYVLGANPLRVWKFFDFERIFRIEI